MLSLNLSNLLLRLLWPDFSTHCWCPSLERRLSLYGRWHSLVSAQVGTKITSTGRHVFIAIPKILLILVSTASFVGSRFWDFPRPCSIFLLRSTGCPRHTLVAKHGFKKLISKFPKVTLPTASRSQATSACDTRSSAVLKGMQDVLDSSRRAQQNELQKPQSLGRKVGMTRRWGPTLPKFSVIDLSPQKQALSSN